MLTLLAFAGLLLPALGGISAAQAAQPLRCRIEVSAGAKGKDCRVKLPAGREVRACSDADRQAKHCDAVGDGRYAAWVVGAGPGHCRISKKATKWDKVVVAKLSKSEGGPSTCDLYVELR